MFKLTQGDSGAWSETILYNFSSSGGNTPEAGVTLDSEGNLYGTTYDGNVAEEVLGTVFELAPNGTLTTLWNFDGPDGELPNSNLLRDSAGNLYGISFEGGVSDHGTVYEVTP
ncbi:MAG: choice-of-anchor tandem repeat GloVer-containing protein [Candidatus Sulfotelmatobacter sp.]